FDTIATLCRAKSYTSDSKNTTAASPPTLKTRSTGCQNELCGGDPRDARQQSNAIRYESEYLRRKFELVLGCRFVGFSRIRPNTDRRSANASAGARKGALFSPLDLSWSSAFRNPMLFFEARFETLELRLRPMADGRDSVSYRSQRVEQGQLPQVEQSLSASQR